MALNKNQSSQRRWITSTALFFLAGGFALLLVQAADPVPSKEERLARHRNLGKAFYENPTTQMEAVAEFKKALDLFPKSARERLNYGLALLRAGKTAEGIAELEAVQKQDPSIPHTWFNLGIQYKKLGQTEHAIEQFQGMVKLVPDEPISHYNLGTLFKLAGKNEEAAKQFALAAKLDPNLAAPHFQLFNIYRINRQMEEAQRELQIFQALKKQNEGSAIPEDVEWSFYAEIYDIMEDKAPAEAPAALKFAATPLAPAALGVLPFGNSAISWSAEGVRLGGGAAVAGTKGARDVATGDYDNDAVMDAAVVLPGSVALYTNVKGALTKAATVATGSYNAALWLDYDHDNDIDLLLLGEKSAVLRNQGSAGFQPAEFPFGEGEIIDAVAFRLIADTKGMDLLVSYKDRPGALFIDRLAGKYERTSAPLPAGARELTAADLTNDGWIDVVFAASGKVQLLKNREGKFEPQMIGEEGGGVAVADLESRGRQDILAGGVVYRNAGEGRFAVSPHKPFGSCTAMSAIHVNSDGRADLICAASDGTKVYTNQTATKNNWIGVALTGIKNAKLSPGAEVEVKAGVRYQKQVYRGEPLIFGLGAETQADAIRITWANGLVQNEMKQPAGKLYKYEEAQRLSGSCPIIWTWNGKEFEYITDVLGVAPLGASAGDGQFFPVDHDEYIQIPAKALREVDGRYEIRITEELAEVSYIDHVRLIAVDHPVDQSIYTNDKFKSPPFPDFRLFGVRKRTPPAVATDARGKDVRSRLLAKDGTYSEDFSRNLSGVAELHHLDLDFTPAVAKDGKAILVLSGWVDWADGSTFLRVAQENKGGLITPYLQVKDRAGKWVTVLEDMGMPAGKPKTIVVDLSDKWLSSSREVRIVTNLCVYWDEIFLAEGETTPQARQTDVPALVSDLRFRGFSPVVIHPQRKQPERFVYTGAKPYSMWNPTPGLYTRFGDVRELTSRVDDKLLIMGSGDELRMVFDAAALPELPAGWTRDFLLLVDGWAKDRDANTAFSQTVEPLPFHGMSSFPYPEHENYPDSEEYRVYRDTYNTRPALRLLRPLAQR